jgi:RNA 2',3'-cyclic 3'-phosphodiesterase
MRLFVAVNLPPETRRLLHQAVAPLRVLELPVRWVAEDALHLTLKFLGEVPAERLPELGEATASAAAAAEPFELRIAGLGAFPSLRRPRVLWAGIQATPPLAALQRRVEEAFADLGFPPEARDFAPHLTLGRVREGGGSPALERAAAGIRVESSVEVGSVDLMRSHLAASGARYERLIAAPLGAGLAASEPRVEG